MPKPDHPDRLRLFDKMRTAGIEPDDSDEIRLYKSLLTLATGLVCLVIVVWVAIYNVIGLRLSLTLPLAFQLLLAGNMLLFFATRSFSFFRTTQLALFLFLPFVAQWSAGNLIDSSGVVLWGVLAPIGAILCIGARESIGWFLAWVVLTGVSGGVDYYLVDSIAATKSTGLTKASLLFFTLNFIAVATISYTLLRFSIEQRRRAQEMLRQSQEQVRMAQDAAGNLFTTPIV